MPDTPVKRVPPGLEHVMDVIATVATPINVGVTPRGERRIIPITGGSFEGPKLRGTVNPGGDDWQIIRADGTIDLEARYSLKTDSGSLISVVNRGIRTAAPEVLKKLRDGLVVPKSDYYFRATPVFETADLSLAWLTTSIFICDAERFPDHVLLTVWRVL